MPTEPDAPPEVNVLELVAKWKKELAGKANVDDSRVLVIPAAATDENQGTVEVWLLPPGIAVPNPYAAKESP
jgi:hypothetical protein